MSRAATRRRPTSSAGRSRRASSLSGGGDQRFQTIVAKHPGKCRRCGGPVRPGDPIRWAPKRGTWHLTDYCGSDDAALAAYEATYGPVDNAVDNIDVSVDLSAPVPASIIGEVF